MVNIKLIRNTYGGLEYLQRTCNYVINKHNPVFVNGYGVNFRDAEIAFLEMVAVTRHFGKLTCNPVIHLVVSFDRNVENESEAIAFAKDISKFFYGRFQVLFAVHHKECENSHYHVHFGINSVSLINGNLFHSSPVNLQCFCKHVADVTNMKTNRHFDNKAKKTHK